MSSADKSPEMIAIGNGAIVERDVLGVAAEISRRWPNLRVQYLEPGSSFGVTEAPYQIVERGKNGKEYVAMQVWQLDSSVIKRLEAIDTNYVDIDAVVTRANENAKREQRRLEQESMHEAHEKFAAVVRSPKDTYVVTDGDKKITIRSNGEHDVRRNRGAGS